MGHHTPTTTLTMKSVILACLVAEALVDERVDNGDGTFQYNFETSNGVIGSRSGSIGSAGQSNIQGVFRYPTPEGGFVEVSYTADERGFIPSSDILPTAHPIPAHVYKLLENAERQRAEGIQFDNRGFRLN